jgi:hypothetical protein
LQRLAFAAVLTLSLAAPAAAFLGPAQKRADLDGDGVAETVKAVRVPVPGVTDDRFDDTAIDIEAACEEGTLTRRIAGPQENLALLRLRNADARKGREVFVDLRSGAAGRLGEARVVAWRKSATRPCGAARQLFRYKTDRHTRTPRGGSGDIASFGAGYRKRRGSDALDVVLSEDFQRRGEPSCCGSIRKTTWWRYSAKRDRYLRYRTRVRYRKPFRP